jgi:hypothetical protein
MKPKAKKVKIKKVNITEAKAFFSRLQEGQPKRESPIKFMPHVLIRSFAGDNGTRPLGGSLPFWRQSPDIWIAEGDPLVTPEIPPNSWVNVVSGNTYTVFAHVWNLGRAPIAGVKVEWYWADAPSLGIPRNPNLIGNARVDLASRGFPGSHKLVKCPQAWVGPVILPTDKHDHCILARVSAFGDPISTSDEWNAAADRHVAQRNLTENLNPLDDTLPELDQMNAPEWKGGAVNISPSNQVRQTFTPTLPKLVAVELGLRTGNAGRGGDQITMDILDRNNNILFTGSAFISEGFEGFFRFNVSSQGVPVEIGKPLTIRVQDTGKIVFFWKYSDGNKYTRGDAFFCGNLFGSNDFYFKSYGKKL